MHLLRSAAPTDGRPQASSRPAAGGREGCACGEESGLRCAAAFAVLDILAQPLVVAGAGGRILFANTAAEAAVQAQGTGRRAVRFTADRRIEAASRAEDLALQRLLAAHLPGGVLLRQGSVPSVVALVSPLPAQAAGVTVPPASAILLLPAGGTRLPSADMVRALFALSPAEAAVALAAAAGSSAQVVAARRGVSEATVRVQLRRVLEKTGTGGLRQLARLFGSLADGLR